MFSNVCIDWKKKEILTILNTDPKKPLGFTGLPGGKAKNGETPEVGGPRELFQETNQWGAATRHRVEIPKTGSDGDYVHYFIAVKIVYKRGLKNHEEPLSTPQWVPLQEIIAGRVKMFRGHIQGLIMLLEKMSEEKNARGKIDRHGIPILSEAPPPVVELLAELKKVFNATGQCVRPLYRPSSNCQKLGF